MTRMGELEANGVTDGIQSGFDRGVLRFITAGSVDDGKSTLIGRLLHDTRAIFEDQLAAVQRASWKRGQDEMDLSLLTDGLEAEREQGITIDVAYRYFSTPKRKFIIADTPGHEQYTRNMVTGASTADASVILVDARKGVLPQTRRHTYIAHLLGVRHILVAINKMDLVGYDQAVFDRIREEFLSFASVLGIPALRFIPLSALKGDWVVEPGAGMPWYQGPTLLAALEDIELQRDATDAPARLPVQMVIRPGAGTDFRGYAGRLASGIITQGEELLALPSGRRSRIREIRVQGRVAEQAQAGDSVIVVLEDELDVSRGDLLCSVAAAPAASKTISARLCWFSESPLDRSARFVLKHTTRTVKAKLASLEDRIDINTLERQPSPQGLVMNDIARVRVTLAQPVFADAYDAVRETGSFILIDEVTNHTLAAGMIEA